MQILGFESAAETHNQVLNQSAGEVASWKIYGGRIRFHQAAYYYIYLLRHLLGLSGMKCQVSQGFLWFPEVPFKRLMY